MIAVFPAAHTAELLRKTNGHMDVLDYVLRYIRYHKRKARITAVDVREALTEIEAKHDYSLPPPRVRTHVEHVAG